MKLILIIILGVLLLFWLLVAFMRFKNEADISLFGKLIVVNLIALLVVAFVPFGPSNPLVKNKGDYSKVQLDKVIPVDVDKEDVFVKMSSNLKFYKDTPYKDITRFTGEREGFRVTEDVYKDKVLRTTCTVAIAGKTEFEQNLQFMNYYLWDIFELNGKVGKWIDANVKSFEDNNKEFTKTQTFDNKVLTFQIKKENNLYLIYLQVMHK